jgi:hypothetical protein
MGGCDRGASLAGTIQKNHEWTPMNTNEEPGDRTTRQLYQVVLREWTWPDGARSVAHKNAVETTKHTKNTKLGGGKLVA